MTDIDTDATDESERARAHAWRTKMSTAFGECTRLDQLVAQAGGAFSACWDDLNHAGVFESSRAVVICDALVARVEQLTVPVEDFVKLYQAFDRLCQFVQSHADRLPPDSVHGITESMWPSGPVSPKSQALYTTHKRASEAQRPPVHPDDS